MPAEARLGLAREGGGLGPDNFKIQDEAGDIIVRHDVMAGGWELTSFRSVRLQRDSDQIGPTD